MRRSKYPSLGILEALERWSFGGVPRSEFKSHALSHKILPNKASLSQKLYALRKSGFIKYRRERAVITEKGFEYINFAKLDKLKLEKKRRDGWWRVIVFDIPEEKRAARELLRSKLADFDCRHLQKSVYVTPYACEKEINELVKLLAIGKHVCLILAKSLGNREVGIARFFT